MRMPADGFFFDGDWLSNWGGLSEEQALDLYAREAQRIYEETPYATCFVGYSYGGGFDSYFGGFEDGVRMMEEPDAVKAGNEQMLQRSIARATEAAGPLREAHPDDRPRQRHGHAIGPHVPAEHDGGVRLSVLQAIL